MTAQSVGLPNGKPRLGGPIANGFGNIPAGMPCREQQQGSRHGLRASLRRQPLERLADRGAYDFKKAQLDGHSGQHPGHQVRDLPRLLGPHRIGRAMPDDDNAPGSAARPTIDLQSLA